VPRDLVERLIPRRPAVVARVAEDHDGRSVVHRAGEPGGELRRRSPEVAVLVDVDERTGEDAVHRAAQPLLLEELRDLDQIGDEHERADLREQVLQLVDEVQPEPCDVPRGEAHVAQHDEARARLAAAAQHRLERDALVPEVAPEGVRQADAPDAIALQPPPPRAVDLASQAPHRRLELALLGGGQVEQRAKRAPGRRVVAVGRLLLQPAPALEQRLEQLGHRAQDVVGLRGHRLDELLVDAELAQVVHELGERRSGQVDRQLLGARVRCDAARGERPRPLHAKLVGHPRERILEGVGVALEDEVLAEHGQAQPLRLPVDVVRRAQLFLGQEAAQVDGLRVLVGVAAVLPRRLALEVLAQAELGRGAAALVHVRVHLGRGRGLRPQAEEQVEQAVVGLDVLATLDQRRAQGVAHDRALAEADVGERAQRVEPLGRRHAHVVAAQEPDEVVDDPVDGHGGRAPSDGGGGRARGRAPCRRSGPGRAAPSRRRGRTSR
jgi:hypothetical protein